MGLLFQGEVVALGSGLDRSRHAWAPQGGRAPRGEGNLRQPVVTCVRDHIAQLFNTISSIRQWSSLSNWQEIGHIRIVGR